MKKRLNLICTVIFLLLAARPVMTMFQMGRVMGSVFQMGSGLVENLNDSSLTAIRAAGEVGDSAEALRLTRELLQDYIDTALIDGMDCKEAYAMFLVPSGVNMHVAKMKNTLTGQDVSIVPLRAMAFAPAVEHGTAYTVCSAAGSLAVLVLNIAVLVLFIKLIVRVNRQQVFEWKNVRLLRRLGVCMLAGTLLSALAGIVQAQQMLGVFQPEGYALQYDEYVKFPDLIMGMVALAAAEIFSIGLKLKEEQSLTI